VLPNQFGFGKEGGREGGRKKEYLCNMQLYKDFLCPEQLTSLSLKEVIKYAQVGPILKRNNIL